MQIAWRSRAEANRAWEDGEDVDIQIVTMGGSVCVLRGVTPAGTQWLRDNLATEDWQWFGSDVSIDHRMGADIIEAAKEEGLTIR